MILQLLITGAPLQLNLFGILPLEQPIFSLLDSFLLITPLSVSSLQKPIPWENVFVARPAGPWSSVAWGDLREGRGAGTLHGLRFADFAAVCLWENCSSLWAQLPILKLEGWVEGTHSHFQPDLSGYWNL